MKKSSSESKFLMLFNFILVIIFGICIGLLWPHFKILAGIVFVVAVLSIIIFTVLIGAMENKNETQ